MSELLQEEKSAFQAVFQFLTLNVTTNFPSLGVTKGWILTNVFCPKTSHTFFNKTKA